MEFHRKIRSGYHIRRAQTPKALAHSIETYLQIEGYIDLTDLGQKYKVPQDQGVYRTARNRARDFRESCPNLRPLPPVVPDALTGLQSIAEWCIEAQKAKTVKKPPEEIPPNRKSTPLSLTRMAQYWGREVTPKKLRAMIDKGTLKVIQLNRQSFIFDTQYLPEHAIKKVLK